MADGKEIILSICVPTYNRDHILEKFFNLLKSSVVGVEDKIEIIVSNNHSTDDTDRICREWAAVFSSAMKFRYFEQEQNIGVVKNITFLLERSVGRYFTFVGDDDCLDGEALLRTIDVLKSENNPSAIIQGEWGGRLGLGVSGFRNFLDAAQFFYEYGNAYSSIIDRRAAQEILCNSSLRAELEETVWPQTVFGFLAIYLLRDRPVFITDYSLGAPVGDCQNVADKAYWVSSLYGLLRASFLIDRSVGFDWTKKAFVRWGGAGFRSHIRLIVFFSLIYKNSDSLRVQNELKNHFGVRGRFWALVLNLSDHFPRLVYWSALIATSLLSFESPLVVKRKIEVAREKHQADIKLAKVTKKRSGDFY